MGSDATRAVAYVLMGFPRVSETFIASEVHRVERAGIRVRLFVIKPVEERERHFRHPVVDAIEAEPEYLPDSSSLTAPLHRWRPAHLRPFLPAIRRVARRHPRGLATAVRTALGQAIRDRRTPLAGPRKIYVTATCSTSAAARASPSPGRWSCSARSPAAPSTGATGRGRTATSCILEPT